MRVKNGKVLIGRSFLDVDLDFDRVITAIGPLEGAADFDARGCYVIPGLVDIHTHGAVGEDFSDGKPEGLQPLADYYASRGVTSYLATTMTLKEETLTPAMGAIRDFRETAGPSAPGSTWRVPSSATPSGGPRQRRTSTNRTQPSFTGSTRPAADRCGWSPWPARRRGPWTSSARCPGSAPSPWATPPPTTTPPWRPSPPGPATPPPLQRDALLPPPGAGHHRRGL